MNRQTCPPAVVFPSFHIRDDHIAVLVQHHPARAHLLPALLERLAPLPTEVISDPDPDAWCRSSWRSFRACLEAFEVFPDAAHVLVVQDDSTPCRDLAATLPTVIANAQRWTQDDPLIALALYSELTAEERNQLDQMMRQRLKPGFVKLDLSRPDATYIPTVATIWPRHARDAMLAVAPDAYIGPGTRPDGGRGPDSHPFVHRTEDTLFFMRYADSIVDLADLTELGRLDMHDDRVLYAHRDVLPPIVGTIPALVAHQDDTTSIINPRYRWARRTALFVGDEGSALEFFPKADS